ncbi:MAG: DNA primase small subunit PriS [Halobacteriaceae archaeon]
MEERTRAYLRGRFGDYYRRTDPLSPPDAEAREWGYIPFTSGPDATMVRHRSLLDVGDLSAFLPRERPRHVYFSVGRYDDPGASTMRTKGWRDADLVFDLDADHLPRVTPGEDSYATMLAECKRETQRLLTFLREDFGFADLSVVFSGGRGYHVHVRDEAVRPLESEARREVVDYVRATGLAFDALLDREVVGGSAGRRSPAEKRTLPTDGGWGRRVHRRLLEFVETLSTADRETATARLTDYDGIGEGKAEAILTAIDRNADAIRAGNIDVHPAFYELARKVAAETAETAHAHIDEPVTTDVNRLIRLPGSLHGGTGLVVRPVEVGALDEFDPLTDAVPETFRGHDVTVDVGDGGEVTFDDQTFTVSAGEHSLPEYAAVFLMARGRAEKAKET